jgi:uncharacterized protein (DUF927 family)
MKWRNQYGVIINNGINIINQYSMKSGNNGVSKSINNENGENINIEMWRVMAAHLAMKTEMSAASINGSVMANGNNQLAGVISWHQ